MDAASITEMLARDRDEWALLTSLLDANPGAVLHEPGSPPWTARDVYAHFARWIGHSTDDFEAKHAGRTLARPEGTDDEINARWQAEDASLTLEEARRRAQAAFDRRASVIQSVPPDAWNTTLDAIAHADGHQHMSAHRRYVEASLGQP